MSLQSISEKIGPHIRAVRKALGLSLEKLAEAAELSVTYVGEIERAKKEPSLKTVVRIATALGVQPSELVAPLNGSITPRVSKYELLTRISPHLKDFYSEADAKAIVESVERSLADRRTTHTSQAKRTQRSPK